MKPFGVGGLVWICVSDPNLRVSAASRLVYNAYFLPRGPAADCLAVKKRKRDAEHQVRLQKRVQRPRIMQQPLGAPVALSRELGFCSRPGRRDAAGNAYASGLVRRTELRVLPESGEGEVVRFARDEVTGGYVMGMVGTLEVGEMVS